MKTQDESTKPLIGRSIAKQRVETIYKIGTVLWDKRLGYRLRYARQCKGVDQAEFGGLFGLSQKVISRIECGRMRFAEITLDQLRQHLGAELFNFVLFDEPIRSPALHPSNFYYKYQARQGNRYRRKVEVHIRHGRGKEYGYLPEGR